MLRLCHPEADPWQALAMITALAAAKGAPPVAVFAVGDAIGQAAQHKPVSPAPHETGIAAMAWTTSGGQPATTILEQDAAVTRVVLTLDTATEPDKGRWTEWLHMANVLQHLGDDAVISTTRSYAPAPQASPIAEPTPKLAETDLLADMFDRAAISLAEAAVAAGWSELVVGDSAQQDHDDTPIEVAWPSCKIGILPSGSTRPSSLDDWDLRTPDAWTVQELLDALEHRAN